MAALPHPPLRNKDCRDVYDGKVIYGRDAFADLRFVDALVTAKAMSSGITPRVLGPIPKASVEAVNTDDV